METSSSCRLLAESQSPLSARVGAAWAFEATRPQHLCASATGYTRRHTRYMRRAAPRACITPSTSLPRLNQHTLIARNKQDTHIHSHTPTYTINKTPTYTRTHPHTLARTRIYILAPTRARTHTHERVLRTHPRTQPRQQGATLDNNHPPTRQPPNHPHPHTHTPSRQQVLCDSDATHAHTLTIHAPTHTRTRRRALTCVGRAGRAQAAAAAGAGERMSPRRLTLLRSLALAAAGVSLLYTQMHKHTYTHKRTFTHKFIHTHTHTQL